MNELDKAIPQNMVEEYLNSKMIDNALQGVESNISSRAGVAPRSAKTGLTEIAQAEIDQYLSNKNKKPTKTSYKKTDLIDPATKNAVSYDAATANHFYNDAEGIPVNVPNPIKREKKRVAGTGTGKPKLKALSDKAISEISASTSLEGDLEELDSLLGTADTGFWGSMVKDFSLKYAGGAGVDDKYKTLKARTAGILNRMMKQMSGAAVSDQEKKRLESQLATMGDDPENFKIKLDIFKGDLSRAKQDYIAAQKSAGRDVSGFEGSSIDQGGPVSSSEDEQAMAWANNNPGDPRAAEILKRLGQ